MRECPMCECTDVPEHAGRCPFCGYTFRESAQRKTDQSESFGGSIWDRLYENPTETPPPEEKRDDRILWFQNFQN